MFGVTMRLPVGARGAAARRGTRVGHAWDTARACAICQDGVLQVRTSPMARSRLARLGDFAVPVLAVAATLGLWELVTRTGVISERDLSAMSTTFSELWSL